MSTAAQARGIVGYFAMGTLLLAALCCSDSNPTQPPCQRSGTATLAFRNESSSATLSIFVDGHYVADVAPGQTLPHEASGGSHNVDWYFKGTHVPVCGPTTTTVAACENAVLACGAQPAPCELSHTGLLVIRNGTDWFPYDIYVDGGFFGQLTPQHQIDDWVSADAPHEVEFRGSFPCFKSATVAACEQLLVICP